MKVQNTKPKVFLTVEQIDTLCDGIKALKAMADPERKAKLEAARLSLQAGKGNFIKHLEGKR